MGQEKKRLASGLRTGAHARERHKRYQRARTLNMPAPALNARLEPPIIKSKHHSYYEIVENKDKKKKLEFQITNRKTPPPGFEFVPIGNPELTQACKELSREQDAMIFIVSNSSPENSLAQQVNRIGHHVRQGIVEQAHKEVSDTGESSDDQARPGVPEPIPTSQRQINEQADSAIRDLFPRIPNTDRQTIIEHSFKLGAHKRGEPLVGLAPDIPLSRRVQLAVLAHIRHTHTRYDQLLKETTYTNARKAVEQLCLDILVKWRGDEENGRDQLDEVLREVIVISDSEGEDDNGDGEDEEADSSGVESSDLAVEPSYLPSSAARSLNKHTIPERTNGTQHRPRQPTDAMVQTYNGNTAAPITSQPHRPYMQDTYAAHRARRGFKRYQAALSTRWDEAVNRIRHQRDHPPDGPSVPSPGPVEYNAVHACHEPLHQVQPSSYHPLQLDSSVSVEPPYHGGARNGLHALDFAARISDRAVPTAAHQRSFSGDLSRGASPHRDPRQTQPPQRVLVRSTEGRDLLVPSIEPISPSSESRPIAPVFVRAVSPHQASRHPRGLVGDIWGQSHVHDSPGGPGEEMSLKRRRVVDDEPYDPRDPPQPVLPRRILSDGWQQAPVHYSAAQPVYNAPRFAPERDFHTHYAHAPAKAGGGRIVRAPGSPPGSHSYYENFRAGPPPGSEHAPIVLNDIDEEPNPVTEAFSARDYRGGVYMERRLSPGGAGRAGGDDSRHESKFVDTYYRGPVHTGVPSDQGNMSLIPHPPLPPPPQDMAPLRLGSHSNERSLAQVQQMHVTNPVERRPTDYNQVDHRPDTYAVAPLPTRYREDLEPAPVFVRRVERFEQPRLAEARTQLVEYQNPDPARVYQDPRQAEHMLALSQGISPYRESYSFATEYSHPPPGQPRYQAEGYVTQGYPTQPNHQYNHQGP